MTGLAASGPLGAIHRLTVASLQMTAGRLRDRAFDTPAHGRGGADCDVRSAPRAWARVVVRSGILSVLLAAGLVHAQSSTPPGTAIRNTGQATFASVSGAARAVSSNEVVIVVEPPRSQATISLLRPSSSPAVNESAGPTQCLASGAWQAVPNPIVIGGGSIDPLQPVPLAAASSFHSGEAIFVRLVDSDQNRDAMVRDVVDVLLDASPVGDGETVRLIETSPSSGEFVGYLQSGSGAATSGDCVLQVAPDSTIMSSYVDRLDATDTSQAQALIDRMGRVFDSRTGQPIDGARVRLVDAMTGQPANVLGDDAIRTFPNEIVTGSSVTDSGGTVYNFASGTFRFPVVVIPGSYRYAVVPPAGYRFPSTADPSALQSLPGAPFVLNAGSTGGAFLVDSPVTASIDVPLDPAGTELTLQKSSTATIAAPGDFVQYTLSLENSSPTGSVTATRIEDVLPPGLRFEPGSVRFARNAGSFGSAADPLISADGRTLTFDTGDLASGERITVRYVAEITVGVNGKELVNRASAAGAGNAVSNPASAIIRLRDALNRDRSFIVGRVADGGCDALPGAAAGVEGVRVYMEDGRYSVTDANGYYHFEDVAAGAHVVQIDTDTVPEVLEPRSCGAESRHAGRAYSQFVDVRGGALWRADFFLATRKPPEGVVKLTLARQADGAVDSIGLSARIEVERVAVGKMKLLVMLPQGHDFVPGSARIDGQPLADPDVAEAVVSFRLGEAQADSKRQIDFAVRATTGANGDTIARAVVMFDSPTQTSQRTAAVQMALAAHDSTSTAIAASEIVTRGVMNLLAPSASRSLRAGSRDPEAVGAGVPNVESLGPGIDWVLPRPDFAPAITSVKVAVRHMPGQAVDLRVNGIPVSALNFYGTAENRSRTVALSLWRGVDIPEGPSELSAIVRNVDGTEAERLVRQVHFAGGPSQAEFEAASSELIADGRTRPLLRLRLTDAYGKPARPGTLGPFRVDPPHRSWFEVESLTENQLVATGNREPTYTVEEGGVALIELAPTAQSGQVVVHLKFANGREQEIRAWLKPAARDWVMVGIAEGTAAYRTLSNNIEAATEAGHEEGLTEEGRVAFFAKGRIRGDFLLTIAYDSARDRETQAGRLQDVIEPDQYYTLYGDSTEQRNEAASQRKLYLKLEREQLYALFGDFDTGLTVTELSRYSRSLNGLHAEFAGEHLSMNAFAARSEQTFIKDELRGDGTSGLYRLSRTPLIIGSEKVRFEVRDRFHSDRIVERRELARFLDYSIDYLEGEIFFKQPVPSRDANFNPVFIIVDYETSEVTTESTTAGGRIATELAGDAAELGVSIVHEGAQVGDRDLAGADLRVRFGRATELRAEIARSHADVTSTPDNADAYLTELTHATERLDGRVYARKQEQGFGLDQQLSTETGTLKVGAEGRFALTDRFAVQGEAYRQEYSADGAEREAAAAEVRYQDEVRGVSVGLRHVADQVGGEERRSELGYFSSSMDVLDERVRLRASADVALGGKDASIDFPTRAIVGSDLRLTPDFTLFAEYEHSEGSDLKSDMTRVGVRTSPWNRAQIVSSLNAEQTEYGPRTFANVGLTQGFKLSDRWALDAGLDQSHTIAGQDALPLSSQVPLASGSLSDDFLAAFAGALYRSELWTFTSRAEFRNSDLEDRITLAGGFYREPVAGHALSLSLLALDSDLLAGNESRQVDLGLGWAYRPVDSRWIMLDRLELIYENEGDASTTAESWRLVESFNANFKPDQRTQLGLQLGARHTRTTFDGERYTGYSDLYGADVRRDLGSRYDIGLQGYALNSWRSDVHEYAFGADFGVTVARNVWIAVGYNFIGFHDEDFSRNRYTDQGPFIKLRIKADQDTFKDIASRL